MCAYVWHQWPNIYIFKIAHLTQSASWHKYHLQHPLFDISLFGDPMHYSHGGSQSNTGTKFNWKVLDILRLKCWNIFGFISIHSFQNKTFDSVNVIRITPLWCTNIYTTLSNLLIGFGMYAKIRVWCDGMKSPFYVVKRIPELKYEFVYVPIKSPGTFNHPPLKGPFTLTYSTGVVSILSNVGCVSKYPLLSILVMQTLMSHRASIH